MILHCPVYELAWAGGGLQNEQAKACDSDLSWDESSYSKRKEGKYTHTHDKTSCKFSKKITVYSIIL